MLSFFKKKENEHKSDYVIEYEDDHDSESYIHSLKINLSRLIIYAESADVKLQREVCYLCHLFVCHTYITIHIAIC